MPTKQNKIYLHYFALLSLIYFVIFLKLDSFHMRWWDESMFAVNTYEMLQNGKYFSLYFDGAPDLFNTKPPLTNWVQLIFVQLLGYNELALRLPSAIAAALSVLILFRFVSQNYTILWAWLSALVLLTSSGFINFHTARTADSDALLTFFLLAGNICFLKFILHNSKRTIFLFLVFISLAFATKMYAALLFTPAYLIILLQQKKLKEFILNTSFFSGIGLLLVSGLGLIYLRELDTPGYIQQILFKDAGRIVNVVENHKESASFYFDNLFTTRFSVWSVLLIAGSLFSVFSENKTEKRLLSAFLILGFAYLVIITISVTKLEWYDMPLYPYLAVIAAYPLYLLLQKFSFSGQVPSAKQTIFIIAVIFIYPYYILFNKSQGNTISNGEKKLEACESYLFKKIKAGENADGIKVYYSRYKGSLLFYKYKLAEKGHKIELMTNAQFNLNDKVLVCDDSLKGVLAKKYKFDVLDSYNSALLIKIKNEIAQ